MDAKGVYLQRQLIDELKAEKAIVSPQVEDAFLHVPRHLFLQHLPLEETYLNKSISTRLDASGAVISSASQPGVVAEILERLELAPGHKVLEIGAGTGYNAVLLGHLVGATGQVVSLDLDEEIVASARANVEGFGTTNVRVERADGHFGFPEVAPYDRIVLSTASYDVFPAWTDQLKEGGRLGLAVRFYGEEGTFIIFEKKRDHLLSVGGVGATFMLMRGRFGKGGEKALRKWIGQGKMFSRVLVYPRPARRSPSDKEIVLNRTHATFVHLWNLPANTGIGSLNSMKLSVRPQ